MNINRIIQFCAEECKRQGSGEMSVYNMFNAYEYARETFLSESMILNLGSFVEPEKNKYGYRITPVTFANGGNSANHQDIPRLMSNIIGYYHEQDITVDTFIKEFLFIHPFVDGNGRTAAILYNYLKSSMDNPVNLPNYFG